MRMTMTILVLVACVAAPSSARAEDKAKPEIAKLQAELARVTAEVTHLREAYNQMSAQASRGASAIAQMAS